MRLLPILLAGMFTWQACDKKGGEDTPTAKANFSCTGYEQQVPCSITFFNTTTNGSGSTYLWNFGDGTTSTEFNPVHAYNFIGTFPVKLKVTGPNGTDSVCKVIALDKVVGNKTTFSYFADRCSGAPAAFSFKSLNPGSSLPVWDFGNGVINNSLEPLVQFLVRGDYTVKFSTLIGGIRDTTIRVIRIE